MLRAVVLLACALLPASAQFRDNFDGSVVRGWTFFTGDGTATMDFRQSGGIASMLIDSTHDQRNIWWALIKRNIASSIDLARLARPGYELRVEARVRLDHVPHRVNLHVNTQRTADFHGNLKEYDIADTGWHTISMTTHGFDARPGDELNVQLALMDGGIGHYRVDLDYYRADVVEAVTAPPDVGEPLPYRPAVPDLKTFSERVPAAQAAMLDVQYPEVNFHRWTALGAPVLSVNGTQIVVLRWDLSRYTGRRPAHAGLLELTTHSLERAPADLPEFGEVRVVEILGGDPRWDARTVTLTGLLAGHTLDEVLNTQMIIDVSVSQTPGGKTYATISRPVLERLIEGRTHGLALRPLGAIHAAFEPDAALYF